MRWGWGMLGKRGQLDWGGIEWNSLSESSGVSSFYDFNFKIGFVLSVLKKKVLVNGNTILGIHSLRHLVSPASVNVSAKLVLY